MGFHKWQPEDLLHPWRSLVDGEDVRGGGGVVVVGEGGGEGLHLFKDCSGRSLYLVIGVSADGQIELVG